VPTTVREYFGQDHERLDAFFEYFQSLKRSNAEKSKAAFKAFKAGLERHIVWEEDLLFPLWEDKSGLVEEGPTAVMRAEHRQIRELLEAIHDMVVTHNSNSDREEQALLNILRNHNAKEERILYPAIDRVTGADERAELFRKLELIPQEVTCCEAHQKTGSERL
jgi:regulator of cell morphogenesis and NO signaling